MRPQNRRIPIGRCRPAVESLEGRIAPALFPVQLDLTGLNGGDGFALNGAANYDYAGFSTAIVGDLNGDGIDDLASGASVFPTGGNTGRGQVYIVFGKSDAFSTPLRLDFLNGQNGFMVNGITDGDRAGWSVAGAGDVNGDGLDDLIIGAPYATAGGAPGSKRGQAYVVFGSRNGFPAVLNLSSLDGKVGFSLSGVANNDLTGWSVTGAGDFNGDGLDDLLVGAKGAPGGSLGGQAYIVFGRSSFAANINLSSLDGNNGFTLGGLSSGRAGFAVAGAGDVNGDGLDDVVVGAPYGTAYSHTGGLAIVVFGRTSFVFALDLSHLASDGSEGFTLINIANSDRVGWSVAGAGDVNGDGLDDVVVGAPYAAAGGTHRGQAYVVFGRTSFGFPFTFLSSLDGSNGFILNGSANNDLAGRAVAGAGDVNGDGLDDVIVGAPFDSFAAPGIAPGQAHVVFGRTSFAATLSLSSLNGDNGFTLIGGSIDDRAGWAAAGAGDVNGDGLADLFVGAVVADPGGFSRGQSYTVFGRSRLVVTGPDKGAEPLVRGLHPDGSPWFEFLAYADTFLGGVRVAVGDVNGDGSPDIITGPGAGMAARIKVFDGRTRRPIAGLTLGLSAYGPGYLSGVFVAAGDVNGDGRAEIIVSPEKGPRPVKVFDASGKLLHTFFPYGTAFAGGVRVAAGDLGFTDARAEIVTARSSGASQVRVWDPANLTAPMVSFKAFSVAGGNFVAVGNVDNDAPLEVIVGAEGLQPPAVRWFDVSTPTPAQKGQLTAYTPTSFHGGVRVGFLPAVTVGGPPTILTAPGKGQVAAIKRFDALNPLAAIDSFFAYDLDFKSGVFVAGG